MSSQPMNIDDALVVLRGLDYYIKSLTDMVNSFDSSDIEVMEGSMMREIKRAQAARDKIGELQIL